eukprot:394979_1
MGNAPVVANAIQSCMDGNDECLVLTLKILQNVINHPQNNKYKNLNLNRISNRLGKSHKYLQLLLQAGFQYSNDKKRLIFDPKYSHKLLTVYDLLIDFSTH